MLMSIIVPSSLRSLLLGVGSVPPPPSDKMLPRLKMSENPSLLTAHIWKKRCGHCINHSFCRLLSQLSLSVGTQAREGGHLPCACVYDLRKEACVGYAKYHYSAVHIDAETRVAIFPVATACKVGPQATLGATPCAVAYVDCPRLVSHPLEVAHVSSAKAYMTWLCGVYRSVSHSSSQCPHTQSHGPSRTAFQSSFICINGASSISVRL